MKADTPKFATARILRRVIGALFFAVLMGISQQAHALPQTIDPVMMGQITSQAGGDTQLENWLKSVSLQESGGSSTWTRPNPASSAAGPLQQLNAFRQGCAAALGQSYATLTANIWSSDPATASTWAVRCAIWYYRGALSSCSTIASRLCGYYRGPGWCLGYSAHAATPNTGGCGYDVSACRRSGVDCGTGIMGTDPATGQPYVQAGDVSNPVSGQTGAINCASVDLAKAMQEASATFGNTVSANTRSVFESSPRGDIRNTQCLGSGFFRYFDLIRAILSGVSAIVAIINGLVTSIIQMICSYITNAITNLINSALSLLCIPSLPGLNLNFGLPSLSSRSCNGTPLLQFETGYGMSMPGAMPSFMNNMSRGIPGSGGSFRF